MPSDSTLVPGPDGRLVLSTDSAVSALAAVGGADGSALFSAEVIRVGDGETLSIQCPDRRPVRVVTELLEVAAGGRVAAGTFVEVHASRAVFAPGSTVVLVGADGA